MVSKNGCQLKLPALEPMVLMLKRIESEHINVNKRVFMNTAASQKFNIKHCSEMSFYIFCLYCERPIG